MRPFIRVQPAAAVRKDFAIWATRQQPKIRTVGPNTFAVPPGAYVAAPEGLLVGALVDGHPYVPVTDEAHQDEDGQGEGTSEAGGPPVLAEPEAGPDEPVPELPESTHGPDSVPLDADPSPDAAEFECPDCQRQYATQRGLTKHRSSAHGGQHGR